MDLGLRGKTALITGGSSGIGLATATLFVEEGATVVISALDNEKLAAAANELKSGDATVHAFACDVTDLDSVKRLAADVHDAAGDIDILVHSAGITGAQGQPGEIDDEGWTHTIETNLLGAVRVTRAFLPALRRGAWGRIVYLVSEDAKQPYPEELPYCAAKAGLLAYSKGLSKSVAADGILVNAVSPAFIATPMTDRMMEKRAQKRDTNFDEAIESFLDENRPHIELKRRGEAPEVASVIAFLCSERASFVNGSNYRVDGGSVASI